MFQLVTDVSVYADALENDTWTVTLFNMTDSVVARSCFGEGSVLMEVQSCIGSLEGVLTALRYRDEILDSIVMPFLGAMGENAVLAQDNARPHTAYVVQDCLEQESIEIIDWPERSPDLNCIEHMWDIVYRQVSGSHNPPRNVQELEIAVVRAWNNVP